MALHDLALSFQQVPSWILVVVIQSAAALDEFHAEVGLANCDELLCQGDCTADYECGRISGIEKPNQFFCLLKGLVHLRGGLTIRSNAMRKCRCKWKRDHGESTVGLDAT